MICIKLIKAPTNMVGVLLMLLQTIFLHNRGRDIFLPRIMQVYLIPIPPPLREEACLTSMTTILNRLRTLQQFLNFLRDKEITIPCYRELKAIVQSVEPQEKIPVIATVEQVMQAIEEVKDLKYKAIIDLLFFGGLRISEVTQTIIR